MSDNPHEAARHGTAEASSAHDSQGSPDSRQTAKPKRWWRQTRTRVLAGAGGVIAGVLILVIGNFLSARLPSRAHAQPTSTSVTRMAAGTYAGAQGSGWPLTPIVLANDYLTVTASMQPDQGCKAERSWVFQQSPQQLAPLPLTTDPNTWAIRNGGIPQSGNYISVTVQGLNGHTVVILSFGVKILSRAAPPAGTAASLTGGCGGLTPSFFDLNLDSPIVQATPVSGIDDAGHTVPAVPLPHVVTESSPEQWQLRILTTTCDCTFVPYFTWSSDGNQGTFEITNGSGPWRVAAITKARAAIRNISGQWTTY